MGLSLSDEERVDLLKGVDAKMVRALQDNDIEDLDLLIQVRQISRLAAGTEGRIHDEAEKLVPAFADVGANLDKMCKAFMSWQKSSSLNTVREIAADMLRNLGADCNVRSGEDSSAEL